MNRKQTSSFTLFMAGTLLLSQNAIARFNDPYAFPTDIPDIPYKMERPTKTKDYSLMTVHLGGEIGGYYDTNIFRSSNNNKEGDFITVLNPGIALETDFEDHGFGAYAELESNFYTSNSEGNYTDLEFGMDGYYTLSNTHHLFADFSIGKQHSAIGSFVDDPSEQLAEPVSYIASSTEIGLAATFKKWIYSVTGLWDTYDYKDTKRRNGTLSIQDDRDRDDYGFQLKGGYVLSPNTTFYMRGGLNDRSYDNRIDSSAAFTRDSDGYEILSGITYEALNFHGDFAVGYMHQDYDASQLSSVSIPAFLFDGTWDIDTQNALRFQADSSIKDTTTTGVSAYIQNRFRVNYTHDVNDQFELGGNIQYINNNFETNSSLNPISRKDNIYETSIHGEYEIYDDVNLNISYGYRDRGSNVATAEYDSHTIGLRLKFNY